MVLSWSYLCRRPGNQYGGFIVPGSAFADFHVTVSQWFDDQDYRFMHHRVTGLAG